MIEHQSLLWQVPVDLSVQLEQSLAAKSSSSRYHTTLQEFNTHFFFFHFPFKKEQRVGSRV